MTGNNHTGSLAQQKSERRAPLSTRLALSTSAVALWAGEMLLLVQLGPWQAEIWGKLYSSTGTEVWDYQPRGNTLLAEHLSSDVPRTLNSELLNNTRYSPGVTP